MKLSLLAVLVFLGNRSAIRASDAGYIESLCSLDSDGSIDIEFGNLDRTRRFIRFPSSQDEYITFQGSTLRDLKWAMPYSTLRELVLHQPNETCIAGMLELVMTGGASKRLGWISWSGWERLQGVAGDFVSFRRQLDSSSKSESRSAGAARE